MADDFRANARTGGTVEVGGSATGVIEKKNDVDWFAVELVAGRTYVIDLEGAPSGGTLDNTLLRGIYDAQGKRIAGTRNDNGGQGTDARLTFTATETATHYVAASGRGNRTGTYTVSVAEVLDDFAADTGTAGSLAVDGSATGEIDTAGDRDWFAAELEAGKTYRVDLKGASTGNGTLAHPTVNGIFDAGGSRIEGAGTGSRVWFTAADTATHYVAASDLGDRTGTYTLSVACVDDFTGDTGTAGRVAVDGSATGEIDTAGDRDWFAVELYAGKTYRIDLKGVSTGDGTLTNPALYGIYDADGILVDGTADNDGGEGENSLVSFRAAETATYYVAAGGFDIHTHTDHTGTYTVSVEEIVDASDDSASGTGTSGTVAVTVPGDDFPAGTGTSGSVAVGGSATGELEYEGDYDWFAVELVAGKTYQIDLKGASANVGTLRDPHLGGIYDRNGTSVARADDDGGVGRASLLVFTATETATTTWRRAAATRMTTPTPTGPAPTRCPSPRSTRTTTRAISTRPQESRSAVPPRVRSSRAATATGSRSSSRRARPTGSI